MSEIVLYFIGVFLTLLTTGFFPAGLFHILFYSIYTDVPENIYFSDVIFQNVQPLHNFKLIQDFLEYIARGIRKSTLENGQKVAGVLGVLSVLVTWEMNFFCISSIFCDFESKVLKSIYTRKMPKKAW